MSNIEKLIDILYDLTLEQHSNIMILHDAGNYTNFVGKIDNYEMLRNYAHAMVLSNAKGAEKMMVYLAKALEKKELEK